MCDVGILAGYSNETYSIDRNRVLFYNRYMAEQNDIPHNEKELTGSTLIRLKQWAILASERASQAAANAKENLPMAIEVARERVQEAAETGRRVGAKVVEQAPVVADQLLTQSRESRLITEAEEAKHLNPVQKFFRIKVLGWVANTVVQSIPSPIGYGVGDVVTLAGAVLGHDLMTGRKLDILGRVIYGAAALVPGVPATVLMIPLQAVRYGVEEAHHAAKQGSHDDAIRHIKNTLTEMGTVRGVVSDQLLNRKMVKGDGNGDGEV